MSKILHLLSLSLFLVLAHPAYGADDLVFINDDLRTGMNKAAAEGKLIFLDFWAAYCTPCRIMEEYTFKNPDVTDRMNTSYVPVRVDIQSFDGYDLKNQFKVTVLPTIIILNSKGVMVGRYEETLSATKLNSILDKHNAPKNRIRFAAATGNFNNATGFSTTRANSTFTTTTTANSNSANTTTPRKTTSSPTVKPNINSSTRSPQGATGSSTSRTPAAEVPTTYNTTNTARSSVTKNAVSETGKRLAMPTTGFTLQTGAFGNAVGAKEWADGLRKKVGGSQKVYVMQSSLKGKQTYRVLVGNFKTKKEVENFRHRMAILGFPREFGGFGKKQ